MTRVQRAMGRAPKSRSPFAWGCGITLGVVAAIVFIFIGLPLIVGTVIVSSGDPAPDKAGRDPAAKTETLPKKPPELLHLSLNGADRQIICGVTIDLGYRNLTDRDMASFQGEVVVIDQYGDELARLDWAVDDALPARGGASGRWNWPMLRGRVVDLLADHPESVCLRFEVRRILWADGTLDVFPER